MAPIRFLALLTFVLLGWGQTLQATPHDFAPEKKGSKETKEASQVDLIEEKRVIIANPPQQNMDKDPKLILFYPYHQSMSPRVGLALDPDQIRDEKTVPYLLGLAYMFPRHRSPHVELSFDILSNNRAHLTTSMRRIYYERNYFRPYWKLGLTLAAKAKERLATVTKIENYLARASVGFEDAIRLPMSVRIEFELAFGLEEQMAIVNFGYSWGW